MFDAQRYSGGDASDFAFHDFAPTPQNFREALIHGLTQTEKAIPCRFLYDERGSQLFEEICALPEYYPTRTELSILRARAGEIAALAGPDCQLIELGSGASIKAGILLDAMDRPASYMPIDISREHLRAFAADFARERPGLRVAAICADYAAPFALPAAAGKGRRIGFFPGSTIGNLDENGARALLALWAERLGPGGGMVIGVDLRKDPALIEAAYADPGGVTEAFIKNVLVRANAELEADFHPDRFAYEARYNPDDGCVSMHLRAREDHVARVGAVHFRFRAGERIHVENSYKYTPAGFTQVAESAGFQSRGCWIDSRARFSVHFLDVA